MIIWNIKECHSNSVLNMTYIKLCIYREIVYKFGSMMPTNPDIKQF